MTIYYIFVFLYEIPLDINILRKLRNNTKKICPISTIIFLMTNIIGFILLSVNSTKSNDFWINCPYIISDLDYNKHYKRRCELYNINNNSRYSNQYICSYDSSKDFKRNALIQEVKINSVICVEVNNLISNANNNIIQLFSNEYKDNKNYFCSRTNIPGDFSYASHKDCNNTKYSLMIIFLVFSSFQFLNTTVYFNFLMYVYKHERRIRLHLRPHVLDARNDELLYERRLFEIHQLINLGRLLMRGLAFLNNASPSTCSTEADQNQNGNDGNGEENFERKKTTNIIIENQEVFDLESNIENYSPDKKNTNINNIEDKKSINLDNINLDFNINSEENKIRDINNLDNIINNTQ